MRSNRMVLLVEDDKIDAMTVKRAFSDLSILNPIEVVGNGEEALSYLKKPGNKKPSIILLDLNMPRMNGIEFLKVVKQEEKLKKIPVVVLTTSRADQDKDESFDLGAAGYMVKPVDYNKFVDIVKTIYKYWTFSELPGETK
ncbi:response regulator [Candidatus Poribacteria bacterium]|nr:response regulator [Candidatus Poribacteria bacterium]